MKKATVVIKQNSSTRIDFANLIVSARITYGNHCEIVVGSPGLQNVMKDFYVGDTVLVETPSDGILEVRTLTMDVGKVELLVSQVSPRLGIVGALINEDPNNFPFTSEELVQVAQSIRTVSFELR